MRAIGSRLTSAHVIACIALFVALGGTVYAAGKLNGQSIKPGSIPGNRLKKDGVTGTQVKEGSLGTVPQAAHAQDSSSLGGQPASSFLHACHPGTVLGFAQVNLASRKIETEFNCAGKKVTLTEVDPNTFNIFFEGIESKTAVVSPSLGTATSLNLGNGDFRVQLTNPVARLSIAAY